MQRHLVILRHGKAERESPTGRDADRPLADRGVRQAGWMGRELADAGFAGAILVTSPAERTRRTAAIVADALGVEPEDDDRLFLSGTVGTVFDLLTEHADAERLIIVGHNPTLSLAASVLTRGIGSSEVSLKTGAAAVCTHAGVIEPGSAELLGVWRSDEK